MTVTNWFDFFSFAYLIAPGLFFTLLARRRRVAAPQSAFLETSDIVFSSMIFTGIGFVVVSIFGHFKPTWFDLQKFFKDPHAAFDQHYGQMLRTLVLVELVAFGAVWIQHIYLAAKIGKDWRMQEVSPWQEGFTKRIPKGYVAFATIRDTEGNPPWTGYILSYTPDAEINDREIVLVRPKYLTSADIGPETEFVILAGPQIKDIVVRLEKIEI